MAVVVSLVRDDGAQEDVDIDPTDLDLDDPADVARLVAALKQSLNELADKESDHDEEDEDDDE